MVIGSDSSGIQNHILKLQKRLSVLQDSQIIPIDFFKLAKLKKEDFGNWYRGNPTFKMTDFNYWVLGSLVLSIPSLYKYLIPILNINNFAKYYIKAHLNHFPLVKNLPYVAEALVGIGHSNPSIAQFLIQHANELSFIGNEFHFTDFHIDLLCLSRKLGRPIAPGSTAHRQFLENSIALPADYLDKYLKAKHLPMKSRASAIRYLILDILDTFGPENDWLRKDRSIQNLLMLLHLICRLDPDLKKKDKSIVDRLIYESLKERIQDNPYITKFMMRILKERFYERLKDIHSESSQKSEHTEESGQRELRSELYLQLAVVFGIIKGWGWKGLASKDTATIIVRLFQKAFDIGLPDIKRELFFLFFYQYPESSILKTMNEYTLVKSPLREMIQTCSNVLKHVRQADDPEGAYFPTDDEMWKKFREKVLAQLWLPEELDDVTAFLNLWRNKTCLSCHEAREKEDIFSTMLRYRIDFSYYIERGFNADEMSVDEKTALQISSEAQIRTIVHQLRDIHLRLENKIKALNDVWESYESFMASRGLYEIITGLLNDATELVSNHFPMVEREMLLHSIGSIKAEIDRDGQVISYVTSVFWTEDDDEARRILCGNSRISPLIGNSQENPFQNRQADIVRMTEWYMYQRFMLEDIARFRENRLQAEPKELGARCAECRPENAATPVQVEAYKPPGIIPPFMLRFYRFRMLNMGFVAIIIIMPFILAALGHGFHWRGIGMNLGEFAFFAYMTGIEVVFIFLVLWMILVRLRQRIKSWIKKRKHPDNQPDRRPPYRRLGMFDLLLPKLLGMLFIAFPAMFLSDEAWKIAAGAHPVMNTILCALFFMISYLFVRHVMLRRISDPDQQRRRTWHVLSLGLLQSFLITSFFTITTGRSMGEGYPVNKIYASLKDWALFKAIPPKMEFKLGEHLTSLPDWATLMPGIDIVIHPWFILFWTIQTLFIGVVLQMFISRGSIVETD